MVKSLCGKKEKFAREYISPVGCPSSCTLQWIKNISFCTLIIWSLSHHWCCKESHDQFFFSICLLNNIKNLYQILKYKSFITFQRLPSFDYKCIAFCKFYTQLQTETNFYEKQTAFILEKTRLAHLVKFSEGPFQSYKKEILFQSALEVF
jgi:hypothetical protein